MCEGQEQWEQLSGQRVGCGGHGKWEHCITCSYLTTLQKERKLMIIRAEGHALQVRAVGAVNRPEGHARGTGAVGAVIMITAGVHTPWQRVEDSADIRVWCARAVGAVYAVSAQAGWCSCRCVGMLRILWVLQCA